MTKEQDLDKSSEETMRRFGASDEKIKTVWELQHLMGKDLGVYSVEVRGGGEIAILIMGGMPDEYKQVLASATDQHVKIQEIEEPKLLSNLTPQRAHELIENHFANLTAEQFEEENRRANPHLYQE